MDVYLLDKNLNRIELIDTYESFIWSERYNELGDCELMIEASSDNLNKLSNALYIVRDDRQMACRIERIELQTDTEEGDHLIITGYDITKMLNQRIVWTQTNFNGYVEDFLRKLVYDNIINPSDPNRKINNFILDTKVGFTETINQQTTYDNLGEKIQETCKTYGWGYRVYINDNKQFVFKLYKGVDNSEYVIFSNDYENISSTNFTDDNTNIMTVALVAGEGEGVDRIVNSAGMGVGVDRYELYVDARNTSKTIEYDELLTTYPNGQQVTVNDVTYYQVEGVNVAILTIDGENISAQLTDEVYKEALKALGTESLAEYKETQSFEGSIIPNQTFIYKTDYDLGDLITIENEYGLTATPRIIEVVETDDESGYTIEPTFEYETIVEPEIQGAFLLNEDTSYMTTENNELIEIETVNEVVSTTSTTSIASKKISELTEVTEIYDGYCMPIVSYDETRKVYFSTIKQELTPQELTTQELEAILQ